jgi:hypothetical protein
MERPLIRFTRKDFLTGQSEHLNAGRGGLFGDMNATTVLEGLGSFPTDNVGLLQNSPSGQYGSGTYVDIAVAGTVDDGTGGLAYLYTIGEGGHLYSKANSSAAPTDHRSGTQITNPANGIEIFQPVGGTKYLYYWQKTQIGRWDLSGSYPTGWTDNWNTTNVENTTQHPTHSFEDRVYYGNGLYIGELSDDGAAGVTHTPRALDIPEHLEVNAIDDDGYYLVFSASANKQSTTAHSDSRIFFWDTNSDYWTRQFHAPETIVDLKRVGSTVYAVGRRGIYQVSIGGGIRKIWQKGTTYTGGSNRLQGPGLLSSFNDSLIMAAGSDVVLFGKPSPSLDFRYHNLLQVAAGTSYNASYVNGEFFAGAIMAADTNSEFEAFFLDGATAEGSGDAQTRYIDFNGPVQISRIDLIFGQNLASGQSVNVDVKSNEVDAATDWGTASFTTHGAVQRVSLHKTTNFEAEQLSLVLNITGACKVSAIEVYGQRLTP